MRTRVWWCGFAAVGFACVLSGADYTWQGGGGLFSDGAKWSPEGVPAAGDTAKFSTAADGTVTWTGDVVNNQMHVVQTDGNTLTLDLGGNTYTLTNRFYFDGSKASSYVVLTNGFLVAPTNTCEMKINAGVAPARLTFAAGATASVDRLTYWRSEVDVLAGASLTVNNQCMVNDGQANSVSALNVLGGDVVCNHHLWVPNNGQVNSTSILNITSGSLIAKNYFSIGDKNGATSVGILNLSGGYLETWGSVWLGNSGRATAIANISGGRWNSKNQFEVAHRDFCSAWLNMTGGEIELTSASRPFAIAHAGGTPTSVTGTVNITGGSITVTNTGGNFLIGNASNSLGRCFIGGDAFIHTRGFKLGSTTLSSGECVMTGGLVRALETVAVGDASTGTGWMRMEGGVLTNLTSAYIGNNGGSTGVLELAGGTWWTSNTLAVGQNAGATGSVFMTGGALYALYHNIGSNAGSTGFFGMSNGTLTAGLDLTVAVNGTGTMEIANGTLNVGQVLSVGKNQRAVGRLVMSDGSLRMINNTRIGDWGGTGTLEMRGGTLIMGGGGNSSVGNGNGSTGLVSMTGGTLVCNMSLYLGNNASNTFGRFELGGGDVVISNQWVLGNNMFSYGDAVVSGGTVWVGDDIRMGVSSNTHAFLTVSGGSVTVKDYVDLGFYGTGVLHVAGGELTAHVLRTTPWGVTNAPTPEIIVSGGRLTVTNIFYFADAFDSTAKLTLSGGVFSLPRLWRNRGYVTVLCDGGALEARRNEANFIDANIQELTLTGNGLYVDSAGFDIGTARDLPDADGQNGKLGKRGAGKFELRAVTTFTGPVVVEGGELALGASGLITLAGGCEVDGGALLNLSATNLNFTLPAATVSRVDGELRLASGRTLTVANGATLGGTGVVGRVVFEPGATLAREAGAALLTATECVIPAGAVIALTGYSAAELRQGVPVVAGETLTVAGGNTVQVTLDGLAQPTVALRVAGGTLTAYAYSPATLIRVQ